MPSRKRNHSPDSKHHISINSNARQGSAKRLKVTSHAPGNQTAAGIQKQKGSSVVNEPEYYTIKSILQEKRGRYLIDWEDDPATGEQFKPTWEPKGYANAEAVADWQRRRSTRRGPNKRKAVATNASSAASKSSSGITRRRKGRKLVNTPSTPSTAPPQDSSPRQEALIIEDSQPTRPPSPPAEYLAVQVSQHSSFDRDQYVQFLASGSTQDFSSSRVEQADSGLGSTSPHQKTIAQRVDGCEEAIVPDSQSVAEAFKSTSTANRSAEHPQTISSYDSHPPAEKTASIATASTPPAKAAQTASIYYPTSPLFSPCSEEAFDTSRVKEVDNQAGDLVTASPGVPEPRTPNQNDRNSPSYSPCAEGPFNVLSPSPLFAPCQEDPFVIPIVKEEDNQTGHLVPGSLGVPDPQITYQLRAPSPLFSPCREEPFYTSNIQVGNRVTESPGVSDLQTAHDYHQRSPLYSPCEEEPLDTPEGKRGDNQLAGGLRRHPDSPPASSVFDARKDIPLDSIELDDHEISSSLIPPAPSQLPESFVSQVTGPPCSLSTNNGTMAERPHSVISGDIVPSPASSQSSGVRVSLRERLKEMRARSAARFKAEKEARQATYDPRVLALLNKRSTTIPDPFSRNAQENGNVKLVGPSSTTRVAEDDAVFGSQQNKHDVQNGSSQQLSRSSSFGYPLLGKMEFAIPLPLKSRVAEQYQQILYNSRHDIERFVQGEVAEDSRMVDDMRAMVDRLIKLTIHSDLLDSVVMTQEQISEIDQVQWAVTCSRKFDFLGAFITAARAADIHVVVMASHGKLLDILETFLKAYHAVYVRPDVMRRSDSAAEGPLRFTLLATTDSSSIVSTAALVIAFDETVNTQDPRVTALRAHMLEVGKLSPLIHLLVVNSAEHIEKCLPTSWTGVQRLQALVSCIAQTRHKVGQLPPEMLGPRGAAEELVAFLSLREPEDQPTLPTMPKLVDVKLSESSSQADSSTQSATQQSTVSDIAPPLNRKRSMDNNDDDFEPSVAKRSRMTPLADITHISDSITQPSQMAPGKVDELQKALKTAEEQLESLKATHASREADLQNTIKTTQQRLQEHVDALSDLQYRYETRSTDLHTLRSERDAAVAASALGHRRYEAQSVEIDRLKQQQRVTETDLKDARTMLVPSAVPEVATLESAKAEIVQLAADKVQLGKRLASLTKDFDFTRQQYQLASTAAAENASALSELQTEVCALKVQASGEAARLRQLNMSTENQVHLERAKQLEATLKERDEILHKKEEELRDLKRGRGLATRASSAPRSPRLGSRASSPMPGLLTGNAGRGGSALRFGS